MGETQQPEATSFLGPGFISGHFFCFYISSPFCCLSFLSFSSFFLFPSPCAVPVISMKYVTVFLSVKTHPVPVTVLSRQTVARLTWSAGALWRCGSWRSNAPPVYPDSWSTQAGARPFDGRTPAGPAVAAAGIRTAAPNNGTAPPAGFGSLHINKMKKGKPPSE